MLSVTASWTRRSCQALPGRTSLSWRHARLNSSKASSSKPAPKTAPIQDPPNPQDTISLLQRPLGVADPPQSARKPTWEQTREDLKNRDTFESKRMQERRHIIKEASRGYFKELNATRRHGGKTWIAPKVLIRENRAFYFPDIEGTTLDGRKNVHTTDICRGKVSVISMLSTRISELHAREFVSKANEKYLSNPLYQYVQINIQENMLRSMLVNLFIRGIRSQVPENLHSTYMLSSQNLEYIREPLGMTNQYIGYTFLVDKELRVRWGACGDPMPEEAAGLERCVGLLLDRDQAPPAAQVIVEEPRAS